ncbi:hypothetical protein CK203_110019 [Vitis vinifera]|uniref:Uncharacterized protein n=1 Tax=Vitis vinifera TaxID=29760 RepID=A0A438FEW6_VITVI|nr:hypothetical protein CK203_110019 [Vitis vinifera]
MGEPLPLGNPLGTRGSACVEVMTTLHGSTPFPWRRAEGCISSEGVFLVPSLDSPSWTRVRGRLTRVSDQPDQREAIAGLGQRIDGQQAPQALPQDSAQYDSAAPSPPLLRIRGAHARMDRLKQRMKLMRVSDGAINWNDFDGAPVANASRRRTWDDLTQEFLRQFAFNTVIDVSRRELEALRQRPEDQHLMGFPHMDLEEGIAKGLWPESSPTDSKGRSPQEDRDLEMWVLSVQKDRDLPEVDTTILSARYTLESSFPEAHGGWFANSVRLLGLYPNSCHLMGSQTSTPSSLISDWVPFEVTPTAPSAVARQGSSIPFTLQLDDDDLEERDATKFHPSCWDNGSALNVCPLSTTIALGYAPLDFGPSTKTVRAYDSTKSEVMGTLMIELLIGLETFPILFQTLEVGEFCRDLVAMSFDQHSSTVVLNMMREADYRYMAHLHRKRVRALLTCTPFDYPVRPYRMSLADYFVRGSEAHPHMGDFDVVTDIKGIAEMVQPESASPFDLFGVSTIEVVEEIQTVLTPELMEDVTVGDDEFEDTLALLREYRDSFDHDSDPINERVSPTTGNVETIDFGIEDQPRELKIGPPLSTDERDRLIHLLKSYLDVFAWLMRTCRILMAPKDMEKTTFITEWGTYCYKVMPFGLRLNPKKCTFEVTSGKLLGHMVSKRGLEVDLDKIRAILDMLVPRTEKEIRSMTRVLLYGRFLTKVFKDVGIDLSRETNFEVPSTYDTYDDQSMARMKFEKSEAVQFEATFSEPMKFEPTYTVGPSTQPSLIDSSSGPGFTEPLHTEIPPPQEPLAF